MQTAPQSMPAGVLVMLPLPLPNWLRVRIASLGTNTAVTEVFAVNETVQASRPWQPPPIQPANCESGSGMAASVTGVPVENAPMQIVPQAIPAGVLVTIPLPVPVLVTTRVTGIDSKMAITDASAVSVTVQASRP